MLRTGQDERSETVPEANVEVLVLGLSEVK